MLSLKYFPHTINRGVDALYNPYYRAHWQPLWAIIGLVLCTLLVLTLGWTAIYDLCSGNEAIPRGNSIADLAISYAGVRVKAHGSAHDDC